MASPVIRGVLHPNLEIEIHDFASSSHSRTSHKIIAEPTGATQIFCKPRKYEHNTNSKNSISRFGLQKGKEDDKKQI